MLLMPKPPRESMVETTTLVLPSHTNALGTIFGGTVMSWIDIAAAITAQQHSQRVCVTASVDALHFIAPIQLGDTVKITAKLVYTGHSSMMVRVVVCAQNLKEPQPRHTAEAYLTFIALDDQKKPTEVPPIEVTTEEEKELYRNAEKRRKNLLSLRDSS